MSTIWIVTLATFVIGMVNFAFGYWVAKLEFSRCRKDADELHSIRDRVLKYDNKMDAEGRPPDGDDYNEIYRQVMY